MGKGDKRTAKGKRVMGSYGVSRPSRPHQSAKAKKSLGNQQNQAEDAEG